MNAADDGGLRGHVVFKLRTLSAEREYTIRHLIGEKMSDQLNLSFALSTHCSEGELIEKHRGIDMPIRSISKYFERRSFTLHNPLKRAYHQTPERVETWLKDECTALAGLANGKNREFTGEKRLGCAKITGKGGDTNRWATLQWSA